MQGSRVYRDCSRKLASARQLQSADLSLDTTHLLSEFLFGSICFFNEQPQIQVSHDCPFDVAPKKCINRFRLHIFAEIFTGKVKPNCTD